MKSPMLIDYGKLKHIKSIKAPKKIKWLGLKLNPQPFERYGIYWYDGKILVINHQFLENIFKAKIRENYEWRYQPVELYYSDETIEEMCNKVHEIREILGNIVTPRKKIVRRIMEEE